MGVTARPKAYPNPQNSPTQPLDTSKLTFYANPNAKTSSPQTAPNGGATGKVPGQRQAVVWLCGHVYVGGVVRLLRIHPELVEG